MSKHKRLFGRDECHTGSIGGSDYSDDTHVIVKRMQHDYAKRPTVASHILKESDGGYNRNSRRLDDERRYITKRRRALYVAPIVIFVFVASFVLWSPFLNHSQPLLAQQTAVATETSQAEILPLAGSSDVTPAANYLETYKVGAARPRIVTIESLAVKARVFEVGHDGRNQPQLPKNSYDTGWYNVSSLPGETGAAVLSGACSGSVGDGVFRRINELQKGAEISVEKGDGAMLHYVVDSVSVVAVDKLDMTEVLAPAFGQSRGINLVGCTGSYDAKTNDFAGRTIVFAVQDSN